MSDWSIYLVRCRDDSLYTGIAVDVKRRFDEHVRAEGRGAKYLRGRGPLDLVAVCVIGDRGLAQSVEYRIKRLSKVDKETLVRDLNSRNGSGMERILRTIPQSNPDSTVVKERGEAK